MSGWASGLAAVAFTALAALHAYWALGGLWPGRDAESLALTVVGTPPGSTFPGPGPTWLVAALLLGAAITVLGAAGVIPLPVAPWLVRGAALLGAGLLLLRGLEGFVDTRLRPTSVGSPFARLNVRLYSPLCLILALLTYLSARP